MYNVRTHRDVKQIESVNEHRSTQKEMSTSTRTIFFDLSGTLLRFKSHPGHQYAQLARSHSLNISEDSAARALESVIRDESIAPPNYGRTPTQWANVDAWWRSVIDHTIRRALAPDAHTHTLNDTIKRLSDDLMGHFQSAQAYELYPDVVPFFDRMRALQDKQKQTKGTSPLRLVLASNSDWRILVVCRHLGLHRYIDCSNSPDGAIVDASHPEKHMAPPLPDSPTMAEQAGGALLSYDLGYAKPQPQFFTDILSRCSLPSPVDPNKAMHVGDSYSKDAIPAAKAGFTSVWLNRDTSPPKGTSRSSIIHLASLSHVADFIETWARQHPTSSP